MRRVFVLASVFALGVALGAVAPLTKAQGQGKTWEAPASAKAVKNPVEATSESVAAGKKMAQQSCAPCHGPGGKGDGPAAAALPKKPADWTADVVQAKTDGELFWMISEGMPPMPPWKSLPETDRWNLVNYMKSLGAK